MEEMQTTEAKIYTDDEAINEAILLFTRKVRRLHPEAFADVIARLPQEARDMLTLAENRADVVRDADEKAGTTHRYMTDDERYGEMAEE
jgi:hypothetical protein